MNTMTETRRSVTTSTATRTSPGQIRRGAGNARQRDASFTLMLICVVVLVGYLVAVPAINLQLSAFEDGAQGYRDAVQIDRLDRTLVHTVGLAIGSVLIALVLGTLLAWAASRLPRRLAFLKSIPLLPLVMPQVATVIAYAILLSPRPGYLNAALRKLPMFSHLTEGPLDIYTIEWIVIITGFSLSSFVYVFVTSGLQNISGALQEAARVSGAGAARMFFTVTLPLLRPSLVYAAGVVLLLGLGQFTTPLLLGANGGVRVLTTEMYVQIQQTPVQFATAAALGSPLLVVGIAVVIAQKYLLGGGARFVTHTGKGFQADTRPSVAAIVVIAVYGFLSTVAPIAALAYLSVSPFWSGTVRFDNLTLAHYEALFSRSESVSAITNSIVYSVAATAIVLPLGFLIATIVVNKSRRNRVWRTILDVLSALPLGIPAVIIGAGFLLTYIRPPFVLYGTPWVMILVYVTLMIPFAVRMQLSTLMALGDTYLEASRVSGASGLRAYLTVILPLMRTSIAGAAALIIVLLTHEFTASLLVRAPTTRVMGTLLFDYWVNGSYPAVATVALVMTVVTGIGVVLAIALGGKDTLSKL